MTQSPDRQSSPTQSLNRQSLVPPTPQPSTSPTDMTDADALHQYAHNGSAQAFRELVTRYTGLAYAAARRQLRGDAHLAEDVTQAVFIVLARRAGSIRDPAVLP